MIAAVGQAHALAAWVLIAGMAVTGAAYLYVATGNARLHVAAWRRRRHNRRTVDPVRAADAVRAALRDAVRQDAVR